LRAVCSGGRCALPGVFEAVCAPRAHRTEERDLRGCSRTADPVAALRFGVGSACGAIYRGPA
jgi:hypothetical protein